MVANIAGYDVGPVVGRGSRSVVYAAVHRATATDVALKYVPVDGPAGRAAARAEAELSRRLRHPGLIGLLDVVETSTAVVLVLERAHGGSLADLLRRRDRLSPAEVVASLSPVAEALCYAHASGVLHRDISAANILFTANGHPKLADLGVAGVVARADRRVAAVGTPAYLDPAVAAGGISTEASDVFSLAAVGLHAATGRGPWQRHATDAVDELLRRAARAEFADLDARLRNCPEALGAVLRRSLDVSPARRGSAGDLGLGLRGAAATGGDATAGVAVTAGRTRVRAHSAAPTTERPEGRPVQRRASGRHAAGRPEFVRTRFLDDGVVPADLTRLAASTAPDPLAVGQRSNVHRRRLSGLRRSGNTDHRVGAGRFGRHAARLGHHGRRVAAGTALVCVAASVALLSSRGTASSTTRGSAASSSTSARPPSTAPAEPVSPADRAVAVLRHLDQVRGMAYARRDPSLFRAVYDSPPLAATDAAQMLATVPAGCRLTGLTTDYRSVAVVATSPGAVVVRATVSVSAAQLHCAGRPVAAVAGTRPMTIRFTVAGSDPATARIRALAPG